MRTILRLSLMTLVSAASSLAPPDARACIPTEYETPTCALYWRAEVVFVAEVKAIRWAVRSEPGDDGVYATVRKARLRVQEVLRGEVAGEVLAEVTSNKGGDCLPSYEKGRRYLIYAAGYDPAMEEIYTGRAVEITPDDEDYLKSVRAFSRPKAEALVLGKLVSFDTQKPMAGVEVLMQSNGQSYGTTTNRDGNYRFVLKPGGAFKVSMVFPFRALEEGYARLDYLSEEPARTVLGYEGILEAGQCHYVEPYVANVPIPQ